MSPKSKTHLSRRQFCRATAAIGSVGALSGPLNALALDSPAPVTGADSLRSHAAAHGLLYGTAVVPELLDVDGLAAGKTTDPYTQLIAAQANILVAENAMKWGALRPAADKFNFTQADKLMRFAALAGQRVRGHNLCWHESIPGWLKTTATKDNARQLLTEHIQTVAGHFRGQLQSWDVVNEAINPPDGLPDGLRKTMWLDLIGPDYLELAFRTAAAADPTAKLTYNDYSIELDTEKDTAKRDAVLALLRRFKAKGVPIHVVGGPDAQDAAVAAVYRDYLRLVLAEPNVPIALTWGIASKYTWLNQPHGSQSRRPDGSRERPLPFDDDLKPTTAFLALRNAIDTAHGSTSQRV